MSCRGRQRTGLRDLRKSAPLLPQYYVRHHWQLRHFCPRGGLSCLSPAPPTKTEQPHDPAGAPPAAPRPAVPPGGPRSPTPLQRHVQRQQRDPVHVQPGLPQARGSGLSAVLLRGCARPKVCAGADSVLTSFTLLVAAL